MNYAIYDLNTGNITLYGYCSSLEQVADHASETVGVVQVGPDVNADLYVIVSGAAQLKSVT